jgi:thymidylate synthase ThyX
MVTAEKPNTKAFQEILLYYLDERIKGENLEIKHLIITNIADWFIIDAQDFEKIITKEIIKSYKSFTEGALVNENNVIFYTEIAKTFFDKCAAELPCVKFNLEVINKLINSTDAKDIEELTN